MAPTVWYHVRNLDDGRRFYRDLLGFEELGVDFEARWSTLRRGEMEIGLVEGEPSDDGVAHVDVADLKARGGPAARGGRRGRDRPRADRRDAAPRRLRPRRQPDPARAGAAQTDAARRRPAGHALPPGHAPPRLPLANGRGPRPAGLPLRPELGAARGTPASSPSTVRMPTARRGTGSSRRAAPGFGFVDEGTPELTIAVVPSHRGHGTGAELLEALLERARAEGYTRVSLSAEPDRRASTRSTASASTDARTEP